MVNKPLKTVTFYLNFATILYTFLNNLKLICSGRPDFHLISSEWISIFDHRSITKKIVFLYDSEDTTFEIFPGLSLTEESHWKRESWHEENVEAAIHYVWERTDA